MWGEVQLAEGFSPPVENTMQVSIAKRVDGVGVLRCVRDDGQETWQKQSERHAVHFTYHDLTHFAVETTLGFTRGFYGLIASGWDIADTTGKGSRGQLPLEARHVETIVGLFDTERRTFTQLSAADFNDFVRLQCEARGVEPPRELSEKELTAVRQRRAELFRQWEVVAPGEELALTFEVESASATG